MLDWTKEVPYSITVCDAEGNILDMNDKSVATFLPEGTHSIIGKNLKDCHPKHARKKIEGLMKNKNINAYTIEKNGVKKLIYQAPWYKDGEFMGLVELSLVLPNEMPHYIRTPKPTK